MKFIDTHCHLEMSRFDEDRASVIERAKEAGLEAVISIASDIESNAKAIALADKYDFIYASVGLHPHDAKGVTDPFYNRLSEWSSHEKVIAIGEIGLDYHYMHSPKETQQEAFRRQLALAIEKDLPAIIHSREAGEDAMRLLKESGIKKGVMHCFSGDIQMAEEAMSMGLYISIAGPVTFKDASRLKEVSTAIPDDYLLIETDSPYLAPVPMRGKRNEPSFIVHTAAEIARLRSVTIGDIARITTLNAMRLFKIGGLPEEGQIAYRIRDSLYLNITNRCTNSCSFCVRFQSDYVKGHYLRLTLEPSVEDIKSAIGEPSAYKEVVFCGYGEPLLRLDAVKEISRWVKERGGRVRINTNGHGNRIHGRNILPELQGIVDSISVSLDAPDAGTYERLCKPSFGDAFNSVVEFIGEAKKHIPDVQITIVKTDEVDAEKCKKIAEDLSVSLRIRELDAVG